MEMTRIYAHGNERGFALLDALLCLFTAALILLLLSGAVSGILQSSLKAFNAGSAVIDERNSSAALHFEGGKHDEP
jgi:hypothetical protein